MTPLSMLFLAGCINTIYHSHRKENKAMKCETCEVMKRVKASNEPACCVWYIDNVVCGDKSVEDCDACEPTKGE